MGRGQCQGPHLGDCFRLPCCVGKCLPERKAGQDGDFQLMNRIEHFAAQPSTLLQFVRNQGTLWETFPGFLRFLEKEDRFRRCPEVENGRAAREKNLGGAKHDGASGSGQSGWAVDDNLICVIRQLGDPTNYRLRLGVAHLLKSDIAFKFLYPGRRRLLRICINEDDISLFGGEKGREVNGYRRLSYPAF